MTSIGFTSWVFLNLLSLLHVVELKSDFNFILVFMQDPGMK